jgi:hypothetical protein
MFKKAPIESDKAKAQFGMDLNLIINKLTLNPIGWSVVGMRSTLVSHKTAKRWYNILCKTAQSDNVKYHINFCMYFRIGVDYVDLASTTAYQELIFTVKRLITDIGDSTQLKKYCSRIEELTLSEKYPTMEQLYLGFTELYKELTQMLTNGIATVSVHGNQQMGVNVIITPRTYNIFVKEYKKNFDSVDTAFEQHCEPIAATNNENISTCVDILISTSWVGIAHKQMLTSAYTSKTSDINMNLRYEGRLNYAVLGSNRVDSSIDYTQSIKD